MFAMLTTACEVLESPKHDPELELTSEETLRVDREGGEFEITYNLLHASFGTTVSAKVVNSDMITAVDTSTKGKVFITISENTTDAIREGAVIVSYESLSFTVLVQQDYTAVDQPAVRRDIVANQLVGNFYGDNLAAGVGHYWIILTKDGFVDGAAVAGGEYFRLDLMAPMPEDMDNIRIPDGEYRFDLSMNMDEFTIINIGNTDYSWVDEDMEGWALPLEDAKLTVNGNRFELEAFVDNTDYHVTFEGDYSLTTSIINDYVSSLTQDTVIDVSNCSASVSSYGDYWDCGYNNWCIEFVCNDGMKYGTYLVIDFLNNSTTDFTGTYVASGFSAEDETMPDFRADVFIPGFRVADDADLLLGSLFMVYKDGLCVSQAPLYEGTVTITSNGDGTYTVVIDALDDAPEQHKITLTWTGTFA
ncbi:MAG: BACON domain-containing protein [Alistipes sp.]|nr:BACON domain-containing protein [Alistipes sp.]MBR6545079.1 BACON domain-containing protein [Alistipes sp.]